MIVVCLKIIDMYFFMSSEYYKVSYIWKLIREMKDVVEILQFKISLCYIIMSFKHKSSMLFHLFQIFLKTASQFLNVGHQIITLVDKLYVLLCINRLCLHFKRQIWIKFLYLFTSELKNIGLNL